jgi:hypothetical protein
MTAHVRGGLVGDFDIDRNGDTTFTTMAMYRIRDGRLQLETAITPPPRRRARAGSPAVRAACPSRQLRQRRTVWR